MEHLSKQQIVLLTLFVSFVTSIATGIVAVSLMNQAPPGVTQTINRVVEKTIERVISSPTASSVPNTAAVVTIEDTVAQSVEKVSKSVVRIKPRNGNADSVTGLGLVLSKEGVIVTDKSLTTSFGASTPDLVAVFSGGKEFPIQVLQSQILGDIVFVVAIAPRDYIFYPAVYPAVSVTDTSSVKLAEDIKLGRTVLSLGGKDSNTLDQGLISKVQTKAEDPIETSISSKSILVGSPLFTLDGNIVGIKTSSLLQENSFYPLNTLKPIIPAISR